MEPYPYHQLFVAKRDQRVDLRGSPGWNNARRDSDGAQQQRHPTECQWIEGTDAEKQSFNKARERERADRSRQHPHSCELEPL